MSPLYFQNPNITGLWYPQCRLIYENITEEYELEITIELKNHNYQSMNNNIHVVGYDVA